MGIIVYIAVSLFASRCSFSACSLVLNLQIPLNSVHLLLGLIHLQHLSQQACQLLATVKLCYIQDYT